MKKVIIIGASGSLAMQETGADRIIAISSIGIYQTQIRYRCFPKKYCCICRDNRSES